MNKTLKKILAFIRRPLGVVLGLLHLNTPARIMVALSPLFVSAAGLLMTLAGRLGVHHLSSGELVGLFETGSLLAASKVLLWLHGAQKAEARSAPPPLFLPSAIGAVGDLPNPPYMGSAMLAVPRSSVLASELHAVPDPRRELLGNDAVPAPPAPVAAPPREVGLPG